MKVVIVGCGKIGTTIVESLSSKGHDVVAIDSDPVVTTAISNVYDVMCVCGSGTECDTLADAGVEEAEIFAAVTGSDELNMLSCFMAKRMGAKHTVARIRNPELSDKNLGFIKHELDISLVVNPELLAAQEIFNILKLPSAINIETFSRRNFEMIELIIKPDSKLDGVSLADLRKKYTGMFLICAVGRGDEVFIPGGDFVLKAGDKIGLTAAPTEIQRLLKQLGILQKGARSVMILGASRMAAYLTRLLVKSGNEVKVIELDKKRCEDFSKTFPEATVIMGDGAEQDVLLEEGISDVDAFVALTGMDEENILISCFASSVGVPKVVSKINRGELSVMARNLGLDTVVSPKKTMADVIVWYARAIRNSLDSNIETLYRLLDGRIEAIEFHVTSEFKYVNVPLKDLKTKNNILIAGIIRGRRTIIPAGDDVIMPNDNVIVITTGKNVDELSDILE